MINLALTLVVFGCMWVASWTLISQFWEFPDAKAEQAVMGKRKAGGFNAALQNALVMPLAKRIERFIKLEEYHQEHFQQTLSTAGIDSTVERYTANALANSITLFCFIAPFSIAVSPVLLIIGIAIAVLTYKTKIGEPQKIVAEKRFRIELELPHFAATISQQLAYTRDVVQIFASYRKVCSKEFESEIVKTLADMKTGNQEAALRSFESRMGSYKLSEVVRGLIGVLNGNNQIVHFEILTNDLMKAENEELRREAIKRQDKLSPNIMLLFLCMAVMLLMAVGQATYFSMKAIF